jgi:hypothetical protein
VTCVLKVLRVPKVLKVIRLLRIQIKDVIWFGHRFIVSGFYLTLSTPNFRHFSALLKEELKKINIYKKA